MSNLSCTCFSVDPGAYFSNTDYLLVNLSVSMFKLNQVSTWEF